MTSPEKIFDELLVLNTQKGDAKAFDLLVRRWHQRIVRQIRWRVGDQEVAKDLAQDCWVAVAKDIRKLRVTASFGSWILRMANNKSVDWLRKQKGRESTSDDPPDDGATATDREELLSQMERAIAGLPTDQKLILRLHYLEGMGLREMAGIMGIPHGTVKSRLFRARENLKQLINQYHENE